MGVKALGSLVGSCDMTILGKLSKLLKQAMPSQQEFPNQIKDIFIKDGCYFISFKVKMMPHEKEMKLSEFLNDDSLVTGLDPLEIRALTQLESYYATSPKLEITSEQFNPKTHTYKIMLKHKYMDKTMPVGFDEIIQDGLLNLLSKEECFKLGYSYALRKRDKEDGN